MATIICMSFCPCALAKPRTRAPRSKKPIAPNPNPNHKHLRTGAKELASIGIEATTFTRLPPKEDFPLLPSLLEGFSAAEVKLSESSVAVENQNKLIENKQKKKQIKEQKEEIAPVIIEDEEEDDELVERFEVFEGSYDSPQRRMMNGAKWEDVVVKVAPGTVIREAGKEVGCIQISYLVPVSC